MLAVFTSLEIFNQDIYQNQSNQSGMLRSYFHNLKYCLHFNQPTGHFTCAFEAWS